MQARVPQQQNGHSCGAFCIYFGVLPIACGGGDVGHDCGESCDLVGEHCLPTLGWRACISFRAGIPPRQREGPPLDTPNVPVVSGASPIEPESAAH